MTTQAHALADELGLKRITYGKGESWEYQIVNVVDDIEQARRFTDLGCPTRVFQPEQVTNPSRVGWEIRLPKVVPEQQEGPGVDPRP